MKSSIRDSLYYIDRIEDYGGELADWEILFIDEISKKLSDGEVPDEKCQKVLRQIYARRVPW